ncbi:MAG: hypothetical protein O7I42_05695, partial [Alphaproteobacteria bacterium]|nr:hypothetical protein [Alphaproteobacteria bacterium]
MESKIDGKTQYMSDRTADNEPAHRRSGMARRTLLRGGALLAGGATAGMLVVGKAALAEEPTDYRFPRKCTMTPAGYPVPLCGRPLTKTPVVIKKKGATLKKYPEHFIPEQEELAANEMRITAVGSGNPPVRRGQAATSWLVELGNGDNFIFDA